MPKKKTEQSNASDTEPRTEGVLELDHRRRGVLLNPERNGKPGPDDPAVDKELVRRFKLKTGNFITATIESEPGQPRPRVKYIEKVDNVPVDERRKMPLFRDLTTVTPKKPLRLEMKDGRLSLRVIDLFCPIGKGQRGLIVAPPRTGKTTLLRDIALGVLENHPECHVIMLLVDERPEEVTDMKRGVPAEIFASSNDEPLASHIRVADLAIKRAKRLVETGADAVILMDSLTRLARAHNAVSGARDHTTTGGLDVRALEKLRRIFSAARTTEEAGTLTIIAAALIESGSRMDDLIYQEFKGAGNMEMVLDKKAAELRLWPAININASGTRREESLIPAGRLEKIRVLRRALASLGTEEAVETIISRLSKSKTNAQFLKLLKR